MSSSRSTDHAGIATGFPLMVSNRSTGIVALLASRVDTGQSLARMGTAVETRLVAAPVN